MRVMRASFGPHGSPMAVRNVNCGSWGTSSTPSEAVMAPICLTRTGAFSFSTCRCNSEQSTDAATLLVPRRRADVSRLIDDELQEQLVGEILLRAYAQPYTDANSKDQRTTMAVNLDKPLQWKQDVALSVDMYNDWFMRFAPTTFRNTRIQTTRDVEAALKASANITNIKPEILRAHPEILATLRMSTCPPLAVDRLIGLSGVTPNLVKRMEERGKLPMRMPAPQLESELRAIGEVIERLADPDIFVWLGRATPASDAEVYRAATIVADRLCGAVANPIIRNAQEKRQLSLIKDWLERRGYQELPPGSGTRFDTMAPGTFAFRLNVPVRVGSKDVNVPIDAAIMPRNATRGQLPVFFEAKSAGDFTNTNKRRKEEAKKVEQLRKTHGPSVSFNLFLCGYFDSGYLGYEAADGIDWVWEHRIDDLANFGL